MVIKHIKQPDQGYQQPIKPSGQYIYVHEPNASTKPLTPKVKDEHNTEWSHTFQ